MKTRKELEKELKFWQILYFTMLTIILIGAIGLIRMKNNTENKEICIKSTSESASDCSLGCSYLWHNSNTSNKEYADCNVWCLRIYNDQQNVGIKPEESNSKRFDYKATSGFSIRNSSEK